MPPMRPAPGNDGGETARYIEQLAKELRTMAAEKNLDFIAFLLGMVEDEAGVTAKRLAGTEASVEG
jgi:hypothetical protein